MTHIKPQENLAAGMFPIAAVIVAALGYFVDIYDLLLFSIVRVSSLRSLGLQNEALTQSGIYLLDVQMIGLLVGGIFWGILGDRKGRLSVLFGSIFIYSMANLANGWATDLQWYAVCRFVAGFGLAGELGAGITLVAELMPKEKRGYATTIVASIGVSGAVAAYVIAQYFDWRTCYFIGGGLGLSLLLLRLGVSESGIFKQAQHSHEKRGNFFALFTSKERFFRYLRCILIGIPLWFVVGILITFSPEFGKVLHIKGSVDAGAAVAICYAGLVLGDIVSGLLSQYLKSRLKVIRIYLVLSVISITIYFVCNEISLAAFYAICLFMGFSVGYWVIFMTVATEQFGTNIRATVTTTVPNFVRGAVVPLTLLFLFLNQQFGENLVGAGIVIGILCLSLAFWSLSLMTDTFSKDLNFNED